MKNRKLLLIVSLVLALTMSLGGTLAYLTDTDADINVMTLGNVKIVQNEQQRVEKDGEFINVLEPFKQDKMLLPVTYPEGRTADTVTIGDYTIELKDKEANYVDKIVTVTNIGNSDAYIRTLVAIPTGGAAWEPTPVAANDCWLHWNYPADTTKYWTLNNTATFVELGGKGYYVWEFVHNEPVAKDKTTYPMVRGFYMDQKVNADDTSYYMDANKNGMYDTGDKRIDDVVFGEKIDILVLSQAVQASGFTTAADAFTATFGAVSENAHTWFGGYKTWEEDGMIGSPDENYPESGKNDTNNPPKSGEPVTSLEDLKNAGKKGGSYVLYDDIHITDANEFFYSKYVTAIYNDMTLDLNGHTITIDVDMGSTADAPVLFYVYETGASLTVVGDGDVIAKHDAFIFFPRGVSEGVYIYGGNYYNNDDTSGTTGDINAIAYSQTNNNIHVYGGTYTFKNVSGHCGGFNVYDNSGAEIVLHEGVLLSNSNYYKGSDADEIHLAEGCTLEEVTIDGETWYKVVKE